MLSVPYDLQVLDYVVVDVQHLGVQILRVFENV